MNERFLFLLYWGWTLICVGVAALYLRFAPDPGSGSVPSWQAATLRWAHPAAWGLLAAAALVRGLLGGRADQVAHLLALGAGACYVVFLAVLITQR